MGIDWLVAFCKAPAAGTPETGHGRRRSELALSVHAFWGMAVLIHVALIAVDV